MFIASLIRVRAAAALLVAVTLGTAFALADQPAFGNHVLPLFVPGNPQCADLAPPGVTWYEFEIQPVEDGTYGYADLSLTLEVYSTFMGVKFDWRSNSGVNAVFVKGGPGGNLYQFTPFGSQATSDAGLHAPFNLLSAEYYGMNHLLFCTSTRPPTPTPPIEPTSTPTATVTPGPTPMPTPTRLPATTWLYLPVDAFSTQSGEPNNSCDEALPILAHMTHSFLADDVDDWYEFDLLSAGHLVIEVTNFLPQDGQVVAYEGTECDSATIICHNDVCNNGESSTTKSLDLGPRQAGRYYLYVSNDGLPNTTDPYQLDVGFP